MIKKLLVLLVACVLFAGCASGDGKRPEAPAAIAAVEVEIERFTVFGEIEETIGNMVTLKLIERPAVREFTDEERESMRELGTRGPEGAVRREISEEDRAALQERFGGVGPTITSGEVPIVGMPAFDISDMTEEEIEAMREQFMENFPGWEGATPGMTFGGGNMYTGETKDIVIPAGAPVVERSFSGGEAVETEISLDKLKAGDIIEVTYASDNETVARVVKQQSSMSMRTIGEGTRTFGGSPNTMGGQLAQPYVIIGGN